MAYTGLIDFINQLEKNDELHRINTFIDPYLEIAEITDRITKSGGKALLFEKTGTSFPVLINAFASDRRMALAIGKEELSMAADDIEEIFDLVTSQPSGFFSKIKGFPKIIKFARLLPSRKRLKGICQQEIWWEPDLSVFPVLKCWPHDAGKFITLPMVHTTDPVTGNSNVGMYRMQILGRKTTAIHWQRHKTGANHFEAWKKIGKKMPVAVTLGGDPVYTYCATAPLPENINEYILAGFLRRKKVKLVKCLTNELYVPSDADIVIEGYVDPEEPYVNEGPFGDHTGFYSLADLYPVFHVTCITYSRKAVYPATIVGIPPQEDSWFAKATEKIFLSPLRLAIQQEIIDFHMPEPGVVHNLGIVKINKSYPGQGMKVVGSLSGAGQMMFTKYLVVVSGNINIRDYRDVMLHILSNTDFESDIIFIRGPLDVLDHASDSYSFGGKAVIDATLKLPEEKRVNDLLLGQVESINNDDIADLLNVKFINSYNAGLLSDGIRVLIVAVNPSDDPGCIGKVIELLNSENLSGIFRIVIAVDHTVDPDSLYAVAWQFLGNTDPKRDHFLISPYTIFFDATVKVYRMGGFPRKWPNVVCSDMSTIERVDKKWDSLGFPSFIPSPSLKYMKLIRNGKAEIID